MLLTPIRVGTHAEAFSGSIYKSIMACYFAFIIVGIFSIAMILSWTNEGKRNRTGFKFSRERYGSCNASRKVSDLYVPGIELDYSQLCPDHGRNITIFNVVFSSSTNRHRRKTIRYSYRKFGLRQDFTFAFLVGATHVNTLEREAIGDTILSSSADSYWNLTLKTVAMLEWVNIHCNRTRFVLKSDDDVFVNVPRLLQFAGQHHGANNTIFGHCYHIMLPYVDRSISDRFCASVEQYGNKRSLAYPVGGAYLLTGDLVGRLYGAAMKHAFYRREDVFLNGFVAEKMAVRRVHVQNFLHFYSYKSTAQSLQEALAIHRPLPRIVRRVFRHLEANLTRAFPGQSTPLH